MLRSNYKNMNMGLMFRLVSLVLVLQAWLLPSIQGAVHYYDFILMEKNFTKLCSTTSILTVNGTFPGPEIRVRAGDTAFVNVHNHGKYGVTIHWHGVKQPRFPWSDGPEYITQCPIKPGANFSQKIIFSDEEGTLWWHAHSDWTRATVHGVIVIYPKIGSAYPFSRPAAEIPIVLGEWWKKPILEVFQEFQQKGGDPNASDALLINGQPGHLYPCSKQDMFKLTVESGKTYLLRIVNAAMQEIQFFAIAKHRLTVVGIDAAYTKQFARDIITISPGQTMDVLLEANQKPDHYYMASRVYQDVQGVLFDKTTTTALVEYSGIDKPLQLPTLPDYNDTSATVNFSSSLRSLASKQHPIHVPKNITHKFIYIISVNTLPCPNNTTCEGPNGNRLAASVNNISFLTPSSVDILQAYYKGINNGVFGTHFPSIPPFAFNYTADHLPPYLNTPKTGTEVMILEYNSTVELVFQGTNVLAGTNHPMHLHGYSFYVVGSGFGNFNPNKDPLNFNLVDPPLQNTIAVPKSGWTAIRFRADNPGVWFMHCHIERHASWGMETVFIVKNGGPPETHMLPPPPDMPPC